MLSARGFKVYPYYEKLRNMTGVFHLMLENIDLWLLSICSGSTSNLFRTCYEQSQNFVCRHELRDFIQEYYTLQYPRTLTISNLYWWHVLKIAVDSFSYSSIVLS